MLNERYELAESVGRKLLPLKQRIEAASRLLELDPELALHAVLRAAEDLTEGPETLRALGRQLDAIASVHRHPTEFEMRDLSDVAFDAFCDPGDATA